MSICSAQVRRNEQTELEHKLSKILRLGNN